MLSFVFGYASCVRVCDKVLQSPALLRMLCSVMLLHHCFELCVLFPFRKLPQQFYILGMVTPGRLHAEHGLVQYRLHSMWSLGMLQTQFSAVEYFLHLSFSSVHLINIFADDSFLVIYSAPRVVWNCHV
jgi:hypothetical protein